MEHYYCYYLIVIIIMTIVAYVEDAVVKGTQEIFIRSSDVDYDLHCHLTI